MKKEVNQLIKENSNIRTNINKILLSEFSKKEEPYYDIWLLIQRLIHNEIEQESYCNQ